MAEVNETAVPSTGDETSSTITSEPLSPNTEPIKSEEEPPKAAFLANAHPPDAESTSPDSSGINSTSLGPSDREIEDSPTSEKEKEDFKDEGQSVVVGRKLRKSLAKITGLHHLVSKRKLYEEEANREDETLSEQDDTSSVVISTDVIEDGGTRDVDNQSVEAIATDEPSFGQVANKYMMACLTCPCWLPLMLLNSLYSACEPCFKGCSRCICKCGFTLYMCISAFAQVVSRIMVFCGGISLERIIEQINEKLAPGTTPDDTKEPLMKEP